VIASTGERSASPWLSTQATVTACKYEFARMNTLTLGISTDDSFLITFSYRAHGRTYTDHFTAPHYLEQNATFEVTYNPLAPEQNSRTSGASASTARGPLIAVGLRVRSCFRSCGSR
jgi:hypothetical protein